MISARTRSDIIRLAVIWVIVAVIAEGLVGAFIGGYPGTASEQGAVTSDAVFFLLWVTAPVFALVVVIIFYSMFRFRVPDDDATPSDSQYRSARAFPWGWVTMSVVLNVLFIIHPGLTGLSAIWSMAQAAPDPMEVDVTAAQWSWTYAYPQQGLKNVRDLVVPVDKPVRFVLKTADVIHSFWVPAWGIKKAVIPGETRTLVVTPDRIVDTTTDPNARVQCSQICGAGHAEMRSALRVVSLTDFDQWVTKTKAAQQSEGSGMNMPGMNMNGKKMPGMESPAPQGGGAMPSMNMNGNTPMKSGDGQTQGAMPGTAPGSGSAAPGDRGMSGMDMPATNNANPAPNDAPMQMDNGMSKGGAN